MSFGKLAAIANPVAFAANLGSGAGQSYMNYRGQKDANATNLLIAREANTFNAEEAAKARDFGREQASDLRRFQHVEADRARSWSRDMANTELQRGVADAKKAGLHPSFLTGGASTPSTSSPTGGMGQGGQARAATAHMNPVRIELPDLMSMGMSLKQIELMEAQIQNTKQDTEKKGKETDAGGTKAEVDKMLLNLFKAAKDSVRKQFTPSKSNEALENQKTIELHGGAR